MTTVEEFLRLEAISKTWASQYMMLYVRAFNKFYGRNISDKGTSAK